MLAPATGDFARAELLLEFANRPFAPHLAAPGGRGRERGG
jgi:hypothetical protein